ncbi:Murein DD-endopeptidase MepM and murein hydrolase activator NlpD, contain LysM domain [Chitinophaga terrae (ex Kim and Jung 2007)]|jgi:murein DD-endopeptidase MepM/ murein hydrolase activator NlpD|uniref:Murein DD-endopeptidase MepM and murein hydrolase activator NlpD, contain LysM domain n=1 Tax=Chitinophaga terrae (ex Kim and Jung 2007) TaxID=408074 RepID=A0A1H4F8I2_9BACT|nr:M23 family metallopeptidase [Chitinophaga terrae (ex Kim and Jung 2007)]MDQ0105091.1 murein DD-endopeptidase MepM/ murein hydrolase activator NlpD [Chitinophaga terrae (ex Kim and Jung 2007)]GEP92312.1 peptidase M23 [Chitinophaga terrae (ex Kim and Jung 2007)]SEA93614.1 Murein DD-endopeptidase MepM and murein hydrolase activator NlpD, contain LysM domain [Chitinophaga terrae (ex Kim and Jung 2007)]
MKKVKYFYNTQTLKYEKLVVSLRVKILRILGFLSAAIVTGAIFLSVAYRLVDSPKEKSLRAELEAMKEKYDALQGRMKEMKGTLADLQDRDNEIYRVIFEASPIPDSTRMGKVKRDEEAAQLQSFASAEIVASTSVLLKELTNRIKAQEKSYDEIDKMIKNKQQMLASIPAIQPVANKDLKHIASGFGYRIDPIYKTMKYHAGLDFAAPSGTPIYSTGDGVVEEASLSDVGYGNHVVVRHGYGYKTLYGHMLRMKVKAGQAVKRGDVLGWVGSTGKSTGPHCHYEVIKNGEKVDPVYYFVTDLTPEQFDKMLKLARSGNQSFD